MKWIATFLLASGLALLAGFSPAVPAAHATALAAKASAGLPNNNPASAHDRRNHRNSNSLHHHRHHHARH